jgi:hypothetical protein
MSIEQEVLINDGVFLYSVPITLLIIYHMMIYRANQDMMQVITENFN